MEAPLHGHSWKVEGSGGCLLCRRLNLAEHGLEVDTPVSRYEGPQAALGLSELALAADQVAAAGLVPGDGHVDEALEEVLLGRLGGAPGVLEGLVRLEVRALAHQLQATLEVCFHAVSVCPFG